MNDATPAGGEAAQPSGEQGQEQPVATVEVSEKTGQRVIKPILGKPRQTRGDGIEKDTAETPDEVTRRRTTKVSGPVSGPVPSEVPAPEPDKPTAEYTFAGVKFKSQDHAEQSFRSLRGTYKSLESRAAEHEGKARGWYEEAQRLQKQLAEVQSGKPQAATPGKQQESATPEDIDWALYAEIRRAADEAGKPYEAERWLLEEYRKIDTGRRRAEQDEFRKQLEASLQPLQLTHQQQQLAAQVDGAVDTIASLSAPDGNPLYPELSDPQTQYEIGRTWREAGLPPELAQTPRGVALAVLLYRHVQGAIPAEETGEEIPDQEDESLAPSGRAVTPQQLAAASMITGNTSRPERADPAIPPEVRNLFANMKRDMAYRSTLGFTR